MKSIRKRLLALFLSVVLLTCVVPTSVLAEATEEVDEYMAGVFQRFEEYKKHPDSDHTNLQVAQKYQHCNWADEIEHIGTLKKSVLWATHKLTDRELNTDAYIDYLSKILTMQEKGLVDTLAAQAEYTASASWGKVVDNVADAYLDVNFGKDLDYILDADTFEALNNVIKTLKIEADVFYKFRNGTINVLEATLLTYYGKSFEQKLAFLTAIRDNTDNKDLKEAADILIQTSALPLVYISMAQTDEIMETFLDAGFRTATGADDMKDFFFNSMEKMYEIFHPDNPNFESIMNKLHIPVKSLAPKFFRGLSIAASYARWIIAGFEIGGALGDVFWGDDIEMFREMRAMDEIGEALSAGLTTYAFAATDNTGEEKYNSIRDMVAAGQALVYVRLRGEYCAVEAIRDKDTAPENLDELYGYSTSNLTRYHNMLATIFPPKPNPQLIVETIPEVSISDNIEIHIALPVIHMPGREEIADKINNSAALQGLRADIAAERDDLIAMAKEYPSTYPYTYDVHLDEVYSTSGVLSMRFSDIAYTGGSHPMSYQFGWNFDLNTGELIELQDITDVNNPDAEDHLVDLFIKELKSMGTEASDYADQAIRDVFTGESYDVWFFTSEGLQITFSPYAIASYASGYIDVVVPYTSLDGILDENYLTPDYSGLQTTGYPSVYSQEAILADSDLQNYYSSESSYGLITGVGEIHDVCVSHCTDYGPYRFGVLFYASSMTDKDVCWLSDAYGPRYIVDFTTYHLNDTGTRESLYISTENGADDIIYINDYLDSSVEW